MLLALAAKESEAKENMEVGIAETSTQKDRGGTSQLS